MKCMSRSTVPAHDTLWLNIRSDFAFTVDDESIIRSACCINFLAILVVELVEHGMSSLYILNLGMHCAELVDNRCVMVLRQAFG
jgi:hypothetical protein